MLAGHLVVFHLHHIEVFSDFEEYLKHHLRGSTDEHVIGTNVIFAKRRKLEIGADCGEVPGDTSTMTLPCEDYALGHLMLQLHALLRLLFLLQLDVYLLPSALQLLKGRGLVQVVEDIALKGRLNAHPQVGVTVQHETQNSPVLLAHLCILFGLGMRPPELIKAIRTNKLVVTVLTIKALKERRRLKQQVKGEEAGEVCISKERVGYFPLEMDLRGQIVKVVAPIVQSYFLLMDSETTCSEQIHDQNFKPVVDKQGVYVEVDYRVAQRLDIYQGLKVIFAQNQSLVPFGLAAYQFLHLSELGQRENLILYNYISLRVVLSKIFGLPTLQKQWQTFGSDWSFFYLLEYGDFVLEEGSEVIASDRVPNLQQAGLEGGVERLLELDERKFSFSRDCLEDSVVSNFRVLS